MHESAWVSAHAFYQGDLDRLLLRVVAPLVDDLAADGLANRFFYLRYWDGGAHLRLRVLPSEETRRGAIKQLVQGRFEQYFTLNPSRSQMSQEQYASLAKKLAFLERLPAYTENAYPNNSLIFIDYRREHDRYGAGNSIEAVERHFFESSRIALDLLTAGISADARTTAATAMILLAWFSSGPEPPPRTSDWARGPGAGHPQDPQAPDPGWSGYADRQRDRVAELARRMRALTARTAKSRGEGTLARWVQSIAALREALAQCSGADDELSDHSRQHTSRAGSAQQRPEVFAVVDTCAHLVCNRLGVSLDEEMALRRIAAQAVGVLT